MMAKLERRLKFRAWLRNEKKMLQNVSIINSLNGVGVCNRLNFENDEAVCSLFYHCDVMQYAGFEDRNGVDVYEGDIVKDGRCKYYISFDAGSFIAVEANGEESAIWAMDYKNARVIGNIYENPELLNKD